MAEFDGGLTLRQASTAPTRLEMSAVVRMRDEPLEYRYDQAVELKPEPAGTAWRSVVREFGLPPGIAMARVVLRDPASRLARISFGALRGSKARPPAAARRRS